MSILVTTLCLSLILMSIFLNVSSSFLSQRCNHVVIKLDGTWRMNKWYTELPDKEDDPHSSFSIRVSDTIVETNRSSYHIQEPIANDEERPAMKKK